MTPELWSLLITALFTLALLAPTVIGLVRIPGGAAWGMSNRDTTLTLPNWLNRAKRTHQNQVENLGPFAVIIIVAHLANVHNDWTVWCAIAYPALRLLFSVLYIAGVPIVRTVVFFFGIAAEVGIVAQLFI